MRFIVTLLLFSNLSFSEEYIWNDECNVDQRSMNNCSSEMLRFYDKELNRLYSLQMNYLQTESRKELFKEAQLAWIKFRDKDCMYLAGKREDSGSIWPLTHNVCLSDRTKKRIKEIELYVSCRDNGCPY